MDTVRCGYAVVVILSIFYVPIWPNAEPALESAMERIWAGEAD